MGFNIKDFLGKDIKPGDTIVCASRFNTYPALKIAKVIKADKYMTFVMAEDECGSIVKIRPDKVLVVDQ